MCSECESKAKMQFAGILTMIMVRTLRRDIARYNSDESIDDMMEETGWKLVHGDVFRPPPKRMLFAAVIGSGIQVFLMALITICKLLLCIYFLLLECYFIGDFMLKQSYFNATSWVGCCLIFCCNYIDLRKILKC